MFPAIRPANRRSQRLIGGLPIIVCDRSAKLTSFREEALTIEFNAHGALVLLYEQVKPGQKLKVLNPSTWDEQDACVVRCAPFHDGLTFVAIKFIRPAPAFWPVIPPDDWKTASHVNDDC